ncbi:hypothetical protein [Streptomyces sp. XD-27]|uniref:terpene synthase family protein n=1 Tax=Streptomyces sp. XD-27 TaxID=3062779 RepID=UPI0026F45C63|nr:hypothetical protein [Streptomyces sp. XD-27]WKX69376.1 hypothetical protein Q3Y56_05090 [Streptomyces sp. XD-27]
MDLAASLRPRERPVVALWCPLPSRMHPAVEVLQAESDRWAAKWGLARDEEEAARFSAIGAGELAARIAPWGTAVQAQLGADMLMWLFAFDDVFCDEGQLSHDPAGLGVLIADLMRTAQTGVARADEPFMNALADLRERLAGLGSGVQVGRWITTLRDYLAYQVWEAGHRVRGTFPSLGAYLVARISNGSMPVCVNMLDVTNGYEAPLPELEVPAVRALSEMCAALVGYDNDLISHAKESQRCGDGLNLVDAVAREGGGLAETVALRDRVMVRYMDLREETLAGASPTVASWVRDLDGWIRGNLDWGIGSARYSGSSAVVGTAPTCTDRTPVAGVEEWWVLRG